MLTHIPTPARPARDHAPGDPLVDPQTAYGFTTGPGPGPRPIHGDASFGRLLGHQRQAQAEHDQCDGLDDETAELLPLMLSLARLSARAQVMAQVQGAAR